MLLTTSLNYRTEMKFSEHLSAHLTPEWRSQYIDYDGMKDMLVQSMAKAEPFVDENDAEQRHRFFSRVDHYFFQVIIP